MSFADYIRKRRVTDTPSGDFVLDARSDKASMQHFTKVQTWDEVESFVRLRTNYAYKVLPAAKQVWRSYQRSKA